MNSGSAFCRIQRGFCSLFLFFLFVTISSRAFAGSGQLVVSPPSVSFGNVPVGSSQTQPVSIANSGGSKITITQATLSGAGFTLTGLTYPLTLVGGQSVTCSLTFTPPGVGADNGSVSISFTTNTPGGGKGHYASFNANNVTVPMSGTGTSSGQLVASPTSISFGNVQVGNSQNATETLTNTGGASVTISAVAPSGSGFSVSGITLPFTLAVGQSANLNVTFSPTSSGTVNGNLAVSSDANSLNVPLSGTGFTPGQLMPNPASLSFGSVATGSSSTLSETLTNVGGYALTISQITLSGSGFTFAGINPPVTLGTNQSATFNVTFAPQAGGNFSGNLTVSNNGSNPTLSIPLGGSGVAPGQLAVSPSNINFGNVVVGTTQSQPATLTASNGPVTVSSATVSQSEFSLTGMALPVTIPAGYSLSFSVVFAPQTSGTASANITFASNASNNPTTQSVTGSGTPPPQHSVALTWNASTSPNVVGYNIYRGTVSGGPYTQINSGLDPTTSDTDSTVQGGQTYYYVVTAVDSAGGESSYSNETKAVIPSP